MQKLLVFNQVTLDGYFSGPNGDLSWAHKQDPEWDKFVADNAKGGGTLLFGRVTYEMMVAFWPTPEAAKPKVYSRATARPSTGGAANRENE